MLGFCDCFGYLWDALGVFAFLAFACAFSLALGVWVECAGRAFADFLVGVRAVDVGGVHFEDFPEAFELEGVEFALFGFW